MDFLATNPLVLLIAACEVGFWVLVVAGLAARYLLRASRLSVVLLLLVPVVDVVLVAASLADIARGSEPGLAHGLAAVYLGVTVGFGHSMIRWADAQFAHRFAGGPSSVGPPKYGTQRVVHEWRQWSKAAIAWVISVAVLFVTAGVAGTGVPPLLTWFGDPMWQWGGWISVVVLIWFADGPLWKTLGASKERVDA